MLQKKLNGSVQVISAVMKTIDYRNLKNRDNQLTIKEAEDVHR